MTQTLGGLGNARQISRILARARSRSLVPTTSSWWQTVGDELRGFAERDGDRLVERRSDAGCGVDLLRRRARAWHEHCPGTCGTGCLDVRSDIPDEHAALWPSAECCGSKVDQSRRRHATRTMLARIVAALEPNVDRSDRARPHVHSSVRSRRSARASPGCHSTRRRPQLRQRVRARPPLLLPLPARRSQGRHEPRGRARLRARRGLPRSGGASAPPKQASARRAAPRRARR